MKLAIDPGHGMGNRAPGVYDPGAQDGDLHEATVALQYAVTLRHLLRERGGESFLTRPDAVQPCPLSTRAPRAAAQGCTHLVSLHLNDHGGPAAGARGLEVLWGSGTQSEALAAKMGAALVAATGLSGRAKVARQQRLAVLNGFNRGPAILIELGFIRHPRDQRYLLDDANRVLICGVILDVLGVARPAAAPPEPSNPKMALREVYAAAEDYPPVLAALNRFRAFPEVEAMLAPY